MYRMRYAIVYRKLVRDLRKQYFIKFKSRCAHLLSSDEEKLYNMYLKQTSELFGAQIELLGFSAHEITVAIWAFSKPKTCIKHFKGDAAALARIKVVHDYLYKFSFEILSNFVKDPVMMMLFYHMMAVKAASPDRINCRLRSLAEHQASLRIIEQSCFSEQIARAYEPETVLCEFQQRVKRAKQAVKHKLKQHN